MRRIPIVCCAMLAALAACADELTDNEPNPTAPPADTVTLCTEVSPGEAPLRRLNNTEYRNTVSDLFGLELGVDLPDDNVPDKLGYDNSVDNGSISQLRADALFSNAEQLSQQLAQQLDPLLPCDPADVDEACVGSFIQDFARRVYRRPLSEAAQASLYAVYDAALGRGEPLALRIELLVHAILVAPDFLYKAEIGEVGTSEFRSLSDYEIATRLAYLLWASTPDEALLARAEANELSTVEQVEAQARSMLEDPRARRGVMNFLMQWIDVRDLGQVNRDPSAYPSFDAALVASMQEETQRFLERVVFDDDGSIADLLLSKEAFADPSMAALYGIEHPGGENWVSVQLPEDRRAGVLTRAAFLTDKAHPIQPAPVQRGKFIRTRLLCQDIPDPPDDVDISIPVSEVAQTNRELLEQHVSNPQCASCHSFMDPIGFGFENYDSIGRYRDTDNGFPVNAQGDLVLAGEVSGPFDGPIELSERLAESEDVQACMVTQAYRYALGRIEQDDDDCSLRQLEVRRHETSGSIRELLIGIATSDSFRFRREVSE